MKYENARLELRKVINEQKTITTEKLRVLLSSMNVSWNKTERQLTDDEIKFLQRQVVERDKLIEGYKTKIANQRKYIKRLEGDKNEKAIDRRNEESYSDHGEQGRNQEN